MSGVWHEKLPVWARRSSLPSTSPTTRRTVRICVAVAAVIILVLLAGSHTNSKDLTQRLQCIASSTTQSVPHLPQAQDTFADYIGRDECAISSLDIFRPTSPVCPNRTTLLDAMSSGGRIGFDAPYVPRGCDMRWYTSGEACEIIGRFSNVMLVGDSLMRHLLFGLHLILRGDLLFGGLREWEIERYANDVKDVERCRCGGSFSAYCSLLMIWDSTWVPGNTTTRRWRCSAEAGAERVTFHDLKTYPEPQNRLDKWIGYFPAVRPEKPIAMVVTQGLWNKIDQKATRQFVERLDVEMAKRVPWLHDDPSFGGVNRIFLSPTAGGYLKGNEHMSTQSMNAIGRFERELRPFVEKRGYEFLGLYNMSIQASSPDGTHGTINQNLLKAQMLLNWLDNLDT